MKCPKCGSELPDNAKFCLECGEKIELQNNETIQSAENILSDENTQLNDEKTIEVDTESEIINDDVQTNNDSALPVVVESTPVVNAKKVKKNRKIRLSKKVVILISLFLVVIIAGGAVSYYFISQNILMSNDYNAAIESYNNGDYSNAMATFRALSEFDYKDSKEKADKCYESAFNSAASNAMLLGYIAYYRCSIISETWDDAIDSRYKDFNTEIWSLIHKWEKSGTTDKTDKISADIENSMKTLRNPPDEWKDAYNDLVELYATAQELYTQSTSPTGSLLTFNSTVKSKYSDLESYFNKIVILSPDVKDAFENNKNSVLE